MKEINLLWRYITLLIPDRNEAGIKKCYKLDIPYRNRIYHLGRFETMEETIKVRDEFIVKYLGYI